jgi:glucose-1-phosphate cytidylyltransferase
MEANYPVVILCGGLGTRMGSKTDIKPKPMLKIGDRPILWHIMKTYSEYGFDDFILTLGYKSDVIKDYFLNYTEYNNSVSVNTKSGDVTNLSENDIEEWNVKLVNTGIHTLKGGRIKRIEPYVDSDRFMLTYGDGVADIDIHELVEFHESHDSPGTISGVNPPSRFGEMNLDGNQVLSFSEKPQASQGVINGGFMIFEDEIFDYLTPDEECDFEVGPLEEFADDGKLKMYRHDGMWECADNQRDLDHLNDLWSNDEAFWEVWE